MLTVAVSVANFGPYHLARLRALAGELGRSESFGGGRLVAYETAGRQGIYPWKTPRDREPFEWVTLFPDRRLEDLPGSDCAGAILAALKEHRPDAVLTSGYSQPECRAMLGWANANRRPAVLMSESQAIDYPRVWWKEAVKRRRIRRYTSAVVGGPRHRDYLVSLGMPADRITFGYNAVDGDAFAREAALSRDDPAARAGLPDAPYFLSVSRFAPEKNLPALVRAHAVYRATTGAARPWDLVLCGDGPGAAEVGRAVAEAGTDGHVHRPGFLQTDGLARWYGSASAFVHPSLLEPWGLVVNEAAACGLPLVVSDRAGCVETFVPEHGPATGLRIDGNDVQGMADALRRIAEAPEADRRAMGRNAAALAAEWGPDRFAGGVVEAIETALAAGPVAGNGRLARIG